jgi:hypothetical protein
MGMTPEQIVHIKRELLVTTASKGWFYVAQIAENSVKDIEAKCFDEDDEAKGAELRRQAKAARTFMKNFMSQIEAYKSAETDFDDNFVEVADQ